MLGRFAALGVDSLDGQKTTDIVMNQKRQCPDSWKAFGGVSGNRGIRTPGGTGENCSSSHTPHIAPRSRQQDASTGGQHGRP